MTVLRECVRGSPNGAGSVDHRQLVVNVVSTNEEETSAALEAAAVLARSLDAIIQIVSFQIVPYPLELNEPCVPPAHTIARLAPLVRNITMETYFQVCYCRDISAALGDAFAPKSLVVIGRKRRLLQVRDSRLTCLLRSRGHDVAVVGVR